MRFTPYPKYKASGVTWLSETPKTWLTTKVKHIASFQTGWTPPTGEADMFEGNNLWANISDLGPKVLVETAKRISDKAIQSSGIPVSPKGSLLFSFKLSIGHVSFAGCDLYTNEAIATFLPGDFGQLSYLYYSLPIFVVQNASTNIYGARLLNQELIRASCLVLPDEEEQLCIAKYLDAETGKVDALIRKQEELITLLQEKRQAVISHAVTKGLDPNVSMKDGGVEWLGSVPKHWNQGPLKRFWTVTDCKHFTVDFLEEGMPIVSIVEIKDNKLDLSNPKRTSLEQFELLRQGRVPRKGDIVFCRNASVGTVAYVDTDEQFCLGQDVVLISSNDRDNKFLFYQFLAASIANQVDALLVGATFKRINVEDIRHFSVAFPPADEREDIVRYLDTITATIDSLILRARKAIELQKEHRIALISAAVTGKIDVRGVASNMASKELQAAA